MDFSPSVKSTSLKLLTTYTGTVNFCKLHHVMKTKLLRSTEIPHNFAVLKLICYKHDHCNCFTVCTGITKKNYNRGINGTMLN